MTIKDFTKGKSEFFDFWYTCKADRHFKIAKCVFDRFWKVYKTESVNSMLESKLIGTYSDLQDAIDFIASVLH